MTCLLGVCDAPIPSNFPASSHTNKIGGIPNWPDNVEVSIPSCRVCNKDQFLVVQLYCCLENSIYHRTLYVFACRNPTCWNSEQSWTVVRCQSADSNHLQSRAGFVSQDSFKSDSNYVNNDLDVEADDWGNGADDWGEGADDWGDGADDIGNTADDWGDGADDMGKGADDWGGGADDWGDGADDMGNGADDMGNGADDCGNGADDCGNGADYCNDAGNNWREVNDDLSYVGDERDEEGGYQGSSICDADVPTNDADVDKHVGPICSERHVTLQDYDNGKQCRSDDGADCLDIEKLCLYATDDDMAKEKLNNSRHLLAEDTPSLNQEKLNTFHISSSHDNGSGKVLESYFINVFEEPSGHVDDNRHIAKLLENYQKSEGCNVKEMLYDLNCGGGGKMEKYEKTALLHSDFMFHKFIKRLSACPEQCIRYEWCGSELFNSVPSRKLPSRSCCHCGGEVVFELQLTPALINHLRFPDHTGYDSTCARTNSVKLQTGSVPRTSSVMYSASSATSISQGRGAKGASLRRQKKTLKAFNEDIEWAVDSMENIEKSERRHEDEVDKVSDDGKVYSDEDGSHQVEDRKDCSDEDEVSLNCSDDSLREPSFKLDSDTEMFPFLNKHRISIDKNNNENTNISDIDEIGEERQKATDLDELGSVSLKAPDLDELERKSLKETDLNELEGESLKATDLNELERESLKATYLNELEKESMKATYLDGLDSVSLKATDLDDLVSVSLKATDLDELERESLKATDLDELGSVSVKATDLDELGSVSVKATDLDELVSVSLKATDLDELGCVSLKATDLDELERESLKATDLDELGCVSLKATDLDELERESLKATDLDELGPAVEFGTVLVYTCKKSCWDESDSYRLEYAVVQTDPDQHLFSNN